MQIDSGRWLDTATFSSIYTNYTYSLGEIPGKVTQAYNFSLTYLAKLTNEKVRDG